MVHNQDSRTACVPGLDPVGFLCLIKPRNKRIVTGAIHTGACGAQRKSLYSDTLSCYNYLLCYSIWKNITLIKSYLIVVF